MESIVEEGSGEGGGFEVEASRGGHAPKQGSGGSFS
jgi:hypothetical protein